MKKAKRFSFYSLVLTMCFLLGVGYAAIADVLTISGSAHLSLKPPYDVYITNVTPNSSVSVVVENTNGTTLFASVHGRGTATFTIDVINVSDYTYVFDRVIDGSETDFDGVYAGSDITYTLSGISRLDEIAPNGGTLSFDVTIDNPKGITAEYYILNFNFIDKFGIPGDEYFPEEMPDNEVNVVQRLSDILNNKYRTDTITNSRDYLINKVIQVISWSGAPYVGSMDPSYQTQLNHLFSDILTDTTVSFILKNEDLNGDQYNEIALYSTSDPLDCTDEWAGNGVVCVYVTVFTPVIDDQGDIIGYNMVCEALHGYCSEVRYTEEQLIPSFSTDTWMNDIGYWAWTEELGSYVEKVPDDAWSNDWTKPFREDFNSYNIYYMYDFWRTAPYGDTIEICLNGKIPFLR